MRTLLLLILVLALGLGAGYYFGTNRQQAPSAEIQDASSVAQHSAPVGTSSASVTSTSVVGLWQSRDDARFTREFQADGTVIDRVQGNEDATVEGTWRFFDKPIDEKTPFTVQPGVRYLQIVMPEEILYFSVTTLSATDLELVYLGVGETVRFTRVR